MRGHGDAGSKLKVPITQGQENLKIEGATWEELVRKSHCPSPGSATPGVNQLQTENTWEKLCPIMHRLLFLPSFPEYSVYRYHGVFYQESGPPAEERRAVYLIHESYGISHKGAVHS